MGKLSVIIPIYNTEQYLEECFDSVINQSIGFDKIILVNDGSTDNSLEICKRYAKQHENIILFNQSNKGQGYSRNFGLRYIDSDYVMFLDSDDYLAKNTVETVLREMEKNHLDILYFDTNIKDDINIKGGRNYYDRVGKVDEEITTGQEYFIKCYPNYYVVSPCMVAFKTSFLKNNNIYFPEYRIFEDVVFTFKSMMLADRVKYIPERLYTRRYRYESTMTRNWTYQDYNQILSVYLQNWNYILEMKNYKDINLINSFSLYLLRTYREIKAYSKKILETADYKSEMRKVSNIFFNTWKRIDVYNCLSLTYLSHICQLILNIDKEYETDLYNYFYDGNYRNYYVELYIQKLVNLLIKLPLSNEESRVGIYGTGYHTSKLIKAYTHLVGNIKCELYFVDSYKKSFEDKYYEKPIINITDAKKYINSIILSSSAYEDEMYDTVKTIFGDNIIIYRFYDKEKDDILLDVDMLLSGISYKSK